MFTWALSASALLVVGYVLYTISYVGRRGRDLPGGMQSIIAPLLPCVDSNL